MCLFFTANRFAAPWFGRVLAYNPRFFKLQNARLKHERIWVFRVADDIFVSGVVLWNLGPLDAGE